MIGPAEKIEVASSESPSNLFESTLIHASKSKEETQKPNPSRHDVT